MGNTKPPVEKKRKKKGRPSLLDLQKRSLRLQKQQEQQFQDHQLPKSLRSPNPNPNPYLRHPPTTTAASRRSTRRNPLLESELPPQEEDDDDDEGDDGSTGKRKEKPLKHVLGSNDRDATSDASGSDSEGGPGIRKRKIDAVRDNGDHRVKLERNDSAKATDDRQEEPSDSGPTTPLPDVKLLEFILDRLQKKDTYGVYSEPVDPNELPDYHEVIEDPMDFGTVRKKLSSGAYTNLEQFENDVFLITSNAMRYNAPDTIYFRQARGIQELAKKSFENLRQESDDNEPEPKTIVRRGRPPSKNTVKKTVSRPPGERVGQDSDATLANAGDGSNWSNVNNDFSRRGSDKISLPDVSTRGGSYGLRNNAAYSWMNENKPERNEEYAGSAGKGSSMKYGKKLAVIDENRRNTYLQPQQSTLAHELPVLTALEGEKQRLVSVGIHLEYAYARSLARFAANLGPAGWEIASKKIERALPPGIKFGRGWVGDSEAPQKSQQLLSSSPPHFSSQAKGLPSSALSIADKLPLCQEPSSDALSVEVQINRTLPLAATTTAASNKPFDSMEGLEAARGSNCESGLNLPCGAAGANNIRAKSPFQPHQIPVMQPGVNGFNTSFGFNMPSQVGMMVRPVGPQGPFVPEVAKMSHARALDMVSRSNNSFIHQASMSHQDVERVNSTACSGTKVNPSAHQEGAGRDSVGSWQGFSLHQRQDSVPPDLNVRFQSPGSPVSGVLVDSQQPDLALQL